MSYFYSVQYEIAKIRPEFMRYRSFSRVRNDIPNCELCQKPFKDDDMLNLAFVTGKKNHLICDECTDKAISGGAEYI